MSLSMRPIGIVKSVFHFKNGTPRQSSVCSSARGVITIEKSIFNNPEHSLMGLEEFSHAWIIFIFHKSSMHTKAKVKPPRLNGQKVGVFSSRSPYRPNNIGLSLVKIDKIDGASLHISGIDILDGTPVIDIKPYIPEYDKPKEELTQVQCEAVSLNSCTAVNITQDTFGYYENIDKCSRVDEQSQGAVNDRNIDHHIKKSDTFLIRMKAALTSDSDQDSNILVTEGQKCHEILTECNGCTNIKEPENSSIKGPNILRDGEDIKNNSDPISEGFYAISSALERAGEKLGRVAGGNKSASKQATKKQHLSVSPPDHNLYYTLLEDLINTEDNTVNVPVDKLFKTDLEPLSINSDGSSHNDFYLSEDLTVSDKNLSDTENTAANSNSDCSKKIKYLEASSYSGNSCKDYKTQTFVAPWLLNPPISKLNVTFTSQALGQLHNFSQDSHDTIYQLQMFSSPEEAERSISDILREDPRSVYRRQHFQDNLYYFAVDILHVTCWFDEDTAQVVRIKPVALVSKLQHQI